MDVTESFPSFTSEKNESPNSIQIIMRTAEITAEDDADHVTDIEVPREDIGMWGRFKAVFVNFWNKILGIFQCGSFGCRGCSEKSLRILFGLRGQSQII